MQLDVLDQEQPIEFDFTKGVVSQDDLLSIATNGMVFSFEVRKDEKAKPYLVAYFGANAIQYRVPRTTAFMKCPLVGTSEDRIAFIKLFSAVVTGDWNTAIEQDKLKAVSALTE